MDGLALLIGPPTVTIGERTHEPAPGKRGALVAYLAWRQRWAPREELTALLWPEQPEDVARANLRQTLFQLRRGPYASCLEIDARRLRFGGDSDVARLRSAVRDEAWGTALTLFRGPFLAGWTLAGMPTADAWLVATREELQVERRRLVARRAEQLERAGDLGAAAELFERLWRDDVLDEDALRSQLGLLARAGRADEAARAAAGYRGLFERELELAPHEDLAALLDDTERRAPVAVPATPPASAPGPPALPVPSTPFVGRSSELRDVLRLLDAEGPRWVTLVGLGGAGKSRLALRAAAAWSEQGGTVGWAPLAALDADDEVASALAESWGLVGPGDGTLDALADRIGDGPALLAIDNAEHVADGVREACGALLRDCPALRILVTSRVALGGSAEQRLPVGGLRHAPDASEAAELFLSRARRAQPGYAAEADPATVDAICAEVGGLPLALELLASRADLWGPEEMLDELRRTPGLPDAAPDAGTGLQTILDATVRRLSPPARDAYLALAPFRGGADHAAVRALELPPAALQELIRHALLERRGRRFVRHPLVERDARARAEAEPATWRRVRASHGRHFLQRLAATEPALLRHYATQAAADLMREDVANLREALLWAVEHAERHAFLRAYQTFALLEKSFVLSRDVGLTRELIGRADPPLRGHLRIMEGFLSGRSQVGDDLAAADAEFAELVERGRELGDLVLEGRSLNRRGLLRIFDGRPDEARPFLRQAARLLRRRSGGWGGIEQLFHGVAYSLLADAQRDRAAHGPARHDALRALAIVRSVGDRGLEELHDLVVLDLLFGDHDAALRVAIAARRCAHEGVPARQRLRALADEARARTALGDLAGARGLTERGLDVSRELWGDLREERRSALHGDLGELALLRGELDEAAEHLEHAGDRPLDRTRRARLALARGDADGAARAAHRTVLDLEAIGGLTYVPLVYARARAVHAEAVLLRDGAEVARAPLRETLAWARGTRLPPVVLLALLPVARLLAGRADAAEAAVGRDLAAAIAEHPAAEHDLRRRAAAIAARDVATSVPGGPASGPPGGDAKRPPLREVADAVLAEIGGAG
jgi:predicted ATPase/DNA-binding SARP family transcriptional activator